MSKTKGSNAERELIHLFWQKELPALRVAGSGSSRYPCPDLLVGGAVKFAIECKRTTKKKKYIPKEEIEQLFTFSQLFGATPLVAIRFNRQPWLFLEVAEVTSITIKEEDIIQNGITIEELHRRNLYISSTPETTLGELKLNDDQKDH